MIRLLISLCIFAPIFLNGQEEFSNVSIHSNQIDFSTQDDVQTYQGYPVFISENKKSIIGLKSNNLTSNYYTESSQFYLWNLLSFNNSCFFVVKNGGSISEIKKLTDGNVSTILNLGAYSGVVMSSCKKIKDEVVFITYDDYYYRAYRFSFTSNQLNEVYSGSIYPVIIDVFNDYLVYSIYNQSTGISEVFAKNTSNTFSLLQGEFNSCRLTQTNDPFHLFFNEFSNLGVNDMKNTWKINQSFDTISKFSSLPISQLYFEDEENVVGKMNYYFLPYQQFSFKGMIQNDSLINHIDNLSERVLLENVNPSSIGGFEIPSPYLSIISKVEGVELLQFNSEDSLQIVGSESPGLLSSMNFLYCYEENTYLRDLLIEYNNSFYTIHVTNQNRNFLAKITDTGFVDLVPIDVDVQSIFDFNIISDKVWIGARDYETKLYTFYSVSIDLLSSNYEYVETQISNEWLTELVVFKETEFCDYNPGNVKVRNVRVDKNKNTFVLYSMDYYGGLPANSYLCNSKDAVTTSFKNTSAIVKLDSTGKLLWNIDFGNRYGLISNVSHFFIRNDGDISIFGEYNQKGYFGNDSLTRLDNGMYYARVDSETGEFIQLKNLFEEATYNSLIRGRIIKDKNDEYYLTSYYEYEIDLGTTQLYSDFNKQNVLLKLDEDGDLIYAENIRNSWTDFYGSVNSLVLDSNTNRLYALCVQNRVSNCFNDNDWKGELIIYNASNGNEIKRTFFNGDLLQNEVKLVILNDERVLLKGVYASDIQLDYLKASSNVLGDCFEFESFETIYDFNLNKFVSAFHSEGGRDFVPLKTFYSNEFHYFLGLSDYDLIVKKYDFNGNYIHEAILTTGVIENEEDFNCIVSDESFVLVGDGLRSNLINKFVSTFETFAPVFVSRLNDLKWYSKNETVIPFEIIPLEENDLFSLFPNPAMNGIHVYSTVNLDDTYNYEIVDLEGRKIEVGVFDEEQHKIIELTNYKKGLYLISIFNKTKSQTKKFIKV
jgi:hypothetical protein